MFLYRPEYYLSDMEAQEQGLAGKAGADHQQTAERPHRHVELFFRKESTRFESFTPTERMG